MKRTGAEKLRRYSLTVAVSRINAPKRPKALPKVPTATSATPPAIPRPRRPGAEGMGLVDDAEKSVVPLQPLQNRGVSRKSPSMLKSDSVTTAACRSGPVPASFPRWSMVFAGSPGIRRRSGPTPLTLLAWMCWSIGLVSPGSKSVERSAKICLVSRSGRRGRPHSRKSRAQAFSASRIRAEFPETRREEEEEVPRFPDVPHQGPLQSGGVREPQIIVGGEIQTPRIADQEILPRPLPDLRRAPV